MQLLHCAAGGVALMSEGVLGIRSVVKNYVGHLLAMVFAHSLAFRSCVICYIRCYFVYSSRAIL